MLLNILWLSCHCCYNNGSRHTTYTYISWNLLTQYSRGWSSWSGRDLAAYTYNTCWERTAPQLVKIFPSFYVTRTFVAAFTKTRHLFPPWCRKSHSHSPILVLQNYFGSIFPVLQYPSKNEFYLLHLGLGFLDQLPTLWTTILGRFPFIKSISPAIEH